MRRGRKGEPGDSTSPSPEHPAGQRIQAHNRNQYMDGTTDRIRILHTSDWHLGRQLYGRRRTGEFEAFLAWLLNLIEQERIQALLISGDIFDTTTPGSTAQRMYYDFLGKLPKSCHTVIISGNHDSPTLLGASSSLLRHFNIHVVTDAIVDNETLILSDATGKPELGVIAVPFLHDRDIRISQENESLADKDHAYQEAVAQHFLEAERQIIHLTGGRKVPVVCMAHLFTMGAITVEGDGVRDLSVGSLSHVQSSIFPSVADYTALGHLHVPQTVGGQESIRYCGSPIPMGFGEANRRKQVCIVDLSRDDVPTVKSVPVPIFRKLVQLKGDLKHIQDGLSKLEADSHKSESDTYVQGRPTWVEINYDGEEILEDLQQRVDQMTRPLTSVEVVAIRNHRKAQAILRQQEDARTLESLTPQEVFARCMEENGIILSQRKELSAAFDEIYHSILTADEE